MSNETQSVGSIPSPDSPMELSGFLFLPSLREVYDCMVSLGQQDKAYLYLEALMVYGTEGRIITDDELIMMGLIPAMKTINASKAEWEKKQNRNKKK